MMPPTIASALSIVLYCLSAFLIFNQLKHPSDKVTQQRWLSLVPALLGLLLHALTLYQSIGQTKGLHLGLLTSFSLITWLISIQILLSCLLRPIETLGIVMFPVAGLASLLSSIIPATPENLIEVIHGSIQAHIMISVIAYSLIMLSAVQALFLAYQDHAIRFHNPGGFIRHLPPIRDMETLLFQFLGFGFVFLTGSLITGFFYLDDIFDQHQAHKTLLSLVAWLTLGTLLFGRFQFGWRGKTAVRWTLSTFTLLLIGFFGSKLVYEFIL